MRGRTLVTWLMLTLGTTSALPAVAQENPVTQPRLTNLDLTPADAAALRDRIAQCWQVPDSVHALADPVVVIQAAMNPDGSVADARILDEDGRLDDPLFASLAQAARRALYRCQPLQLPAEAYDDWREITFSFDAATLN